VGTSGPSVAYSVNKAGDEKRAKGGFLTPVFPVVFFRVKHNGLNEKGYGWPFESIQSTRGLLHRVYLFTYVTYGL